VVTALITTTRPALDGDRTVQPQQVVPRRPALRRDRQRRMPWRDNGMGGLLDQRCGLYFAGRPRGGPHRASEPWYAPTRKAVTV
jgi:hypothetical protein